jgi:hypothetical protein
MRNLWCIGKEGEKFTFPNWGVCLAAFERLIGNFTLQKLRN